MKKIIIIAGIILLAIVIIPKNQTTRTNKQTNNNLTKTQTTKTIKQGEVGIVSHSLEYGIINIVIKNNTGKELEYIKVIAECYDKDGNRLSVPYAQENHINTKDTYKLKIYAGETKKYNLKLEYK